MEHEQKISRSLPLGHCVHGEAVGSDRPPFGPKRGVPHAGLLKRYILQPFETCFFFTKCFFSRMHGCLYRLAPGGLQLLDPGVDSCPIPGHPLWIPSNFEEICSFIHKLRFPTGLCLQIGKAQTKEVAFPWYIIPEHRAQNVAIPTLKQLPLRSSRTASGKATTGPDTPAGP